VSGADAHEKTSERTKRPHTADAPDEARVVRSAIVRSDSVPDHAARRRDRFRIQAGTTACRPVRGVEP
jgi:hypothetical protein